MPSSKVIQSYQHTPQIGTLLQPYKPLLFVQLLWYTPVLVVSFDLNDYDEILIFFTLTCLGSKLHAILNWEA